MTYESENSALEDHRPGRSEPFDLLRRGVALVLLAFASIPALATCAVLWLQLGRPLIFRQVRSGLERRPFTVVKFRTMHDLKGADGQPLPDAQRSTALTRFIRRSKLDEIPQLIAIAAGEMAFIGPRPLLPVTVASFGVHGVHRCRVRPGLTGWAQVNGGTRLTNIQKLALDLWYIDHRSILLNVWILLLTVAMLVRGERLREKPLAQAQAYLATLSNSTAANGRRLAERRQMRVALAGAPGLVGSARDALADAGQEPGMLLCIPTSPSGDTASHDMAAKDAHGRDGQADGDAKIQAAELVALLDEFDPDVLFLLDCPHLFSPQARSIAKVGVIGFHPSPLPLMRGVAPVSAAILGNVGETGASLHWMEAADDGGPLLMQLPIRLDGQETAQSLWRKQTDALASMMPGALDLLRTGNPPRIEQDIDRTTYCRELQPEDLLIDWAAPAEDISRHIRAFGGVGPGASAVIGGARVRIDEVRVLPDADGDGGAPGDVLRKTAKGFVITCGDGSRIEVTAWRRHDGRTLREMPSRQSVLGVGA